MPALEIWSLVNFEALLSKLLGWVVVFLHLVVLIIVVIFIIRFLYTKNGNWWQIAFPILYALAWLLYIFMGRSADSISYWLLVAPGVIIIFLTPVFFFLIRKIILDKFLLKAARICFMTSVLALIILIVSFLLGVYIKSQTVPPGYYQEDTSPITEIEKSPTTPPVGIGDE